MFRDLVFDVPPVVPVFIDLHLTGERLGEFLQAGEAQPMSESVVDDDRFPFPLAFLEKFQSLVELFRCDGRTFARDLDPFIVTDLDLRLNVQFGGKSHFPFVKINIQNFREINRPDFFFFKSFLVHFRDQFLDDFFLGEFVVPGFQDMPGDFSLTEPFDLHDFSEFSVDFIKFLQHALPGNFEFQFQPDRVQFFNGQFHGFPASAISCRLHPEFLAQINFLCFRVVNQILRRPRNKDFPVGDEIGPVGNGQRLAHVMVR